MLTAQGSLFELAVIEWMEKQESRKRLSDVASREGVTRTRSAYLARAETHVTCP